MSTQSTSAEEEGTPSDPDFFGYDFLEQLFAQEDVDGGLIGGASLKADDFLKIIEA